VIRLGSNTWASALFERLGPRRPFIAATVLGLTATFLYGLGLGFAVFLAGRILWGIAWSALRQGGYQAVWTGSPAAKGRLMGLLWGVVRLGSAVSVVAGGILYDRFGYGVTLTVITLATALAIPSAAAIRWPGLPLPEHHLPQPQKRSGYFRAGWRDVLDAPVGRWLVAATFFQFLLGGVVIPTTSVFLASRLGADNSLLGLGIGVATVTGMLQGLRWTTDLLFGPGVGWLSDRLGQANTASVIALILLSCLCGASVLPVAWAIGCLFLVFICDGSLNRVLSAAASGAAMLTERPHLFVGIFTTLSDAGSALGPLLAFSIAAWLGLPLVYIAIAGILALLVWRYWQLARLV
jgi:MFS family permease